MMKYLAGVREEIDQAVAFYDSQRAGLGGEFLDAVFKGFDEIEAHPLQNPRVGLRGVNRNYCYHLIERFRYQIVYQQIEDDIEVVAVAHTSRRPGYWKKRRG